MREKLIFFVAIAVMIAHTFGAADGIIAGLKVNADGNTISVSPGVCRIDGKAVTVATPRSFTIDLPAHKPVVDEPYVLSSDAPDRWARGTRLKGCLFGDGVGTSLPNCLITGTVSVKLADGTAMERDKDYFLDEKWAALSRIEGGRIPKDAKVLISYSVGLMRFYGIDVSHGGVLSMAMGLERKTAAEPVSEFVHFKRTANIYMPAGALTVEAWQIFPPRQEFPEPDNAERARRAALIPKSNKKLANKEPMTIVMWGDSVTAGGDASSPDKAFAQLFPAELQKRFPNPKITSINAGIGATNTDHRLPNLDKEVLSHHPDLVVIEFVNDMPFDGPHLRRNYAKIIDQIHSAGAEIILITPHFTMPEMMLKEHPRGPETRRAVVILRAIASEYKIAIADVSRRWEHLEFEGIPYTTLLRNGINHPDDRGHELFVKELLTFFSK